MACGVTSMRISTFLGLIISLALAIYSAILFTNLYDTYYDGSTGADVLKFWRGGFAKVGWDRMKEIRIKIFCTGTVMTFTGLQFLSSILVILCAGGKSSSPTTKLYMFLNTFTLLSLCAVIACYLTTGPDLGIDFYEDRQVQGFLGGCALDVIYLLYIGCVAGAFLRN